MKAIKISENVYWVGAIDWKLRNFHGYLTQRGSTYNAYLIIDEKITLVDTVKSYMCEEMLCRIASIVDPTKIDYVICNHVEMDHSGSLPHVMDIAKNAVIVTSANGEKGLNKHFSNDWKKEIVQNASNINLGKTSLQFVLAPMVHWPDSMVAYMPERKILFSNDAFGQHLASAERFNDEVPDLVFAEAAKYYANIVLPYGEQVKKLLQQASQLKIETIAPSHGLIWRSNIDKIIGLYSKWASNETEKRGIIVYDTMWGSTEQLAHKICDAFEDKNIPMTMIHLSHDHISDAMTHVMNARFICVGSPTLNNNMLPTVAAFMTYMKGLAPKKRVGIAFGSFGWGGQSISQLENELISCGFEVPIKELKVQYRPTKDDCEKIREKIRQFLEKE